MKYKSLFSKALLVTISIVAMLSSATAQPAGWHPDSNDKILNCQGPSGHHVYFRDLTCPLGNEEFKALSLGTHSTYGRHLDWRPISYLNFPIPLAVCPSNGFVIAKQDYSEEELDEIGRYVNSDTYQSLYAQKHASFYLLAKINQATNAQSDVWWQLLNASWEAGNCNDDVKYRQYAQEALDAAKTKLENTDNADPLYWVLNVVIPNLHRRMGEFDESKNWVEGLNGALPDDEKSKDFYKLAFDLLNEAIENENTSSIEIRENSIRSRINTNHD